MDALNASSLPPGFGFHPTDVELVSHYLKRKILGLKFELEVIPEVDIYKHEPWDLPGKTQIQSRDGKWHFFNTRDRKYPNGFRSNRATEAGYWKSTGKDRMVRFHHRAIGTKKTLVFHKGRPPTGKRTDWIMHEYYLNENECKAMAAGDKELFVLCRITKRNCLASENEDAHNKIDLKSDPCAPTCNESFTETLGNASAASGQSMPTLEDINCEEWITELYDPNFCVAPTSTECKIEQEVESISFAPQNERDGSLHVPLDVEHDSLIKAIDFLDADQLDHSFFEELDYWAYLDENAFIQSSTPPMNLVDKYEPGYAEDMNVKKENIRELGLNAGLCPKDTSDTGIHIRERPIRTFTEAPIHKIRLQVHKTQTKNSESTNHTVMLDSSSHRLDLNESDVSKKPTSSVQDSPIVKKEIISEEPSTEGYEESYISITNQSEVLPERTSSRPYRTSIRGLARQVLKDARVLMRRCSPSLNCLFMGTCLTGAAAFSGYILDENI